VIAKTLLSGEVFPLRPTDTTALALSWMEEMKVSHLPLTEEGVYQGLVREEELMQAEPDDEVRNHTQPRLEAAYALEDTHVFDVLRVATGYHLDVVPVLDTDRNYVGAVGARDLLTGLGNLFSVQSEGSMLVLNIPPRSYSPAEISRIAESSGATVEGMFLSRSNDNEHSQVTLKVSTQDLPSLAAAYERFGYTVAASYHHHAPDSVYKRNYEALMRFLEV
jgi:predicted transcriptional regulator